MACTNNIVLATYTARGFRGKRDVSLDLSISMAEQTDWKVSALKPTGMFKHTSLVFESPTGDTFFIDLYVVNDEVTLRSRKIDLTDARYQHLEKEYRGTVKESASNLVRISAKVLKQLGSYQYILNNCQNYTEELAKELGCRVCLTGVDKVILGAVAVGAVGMAGASLYESWKSGAKTDEKK